MPMWSEVIQGLQTSWDAHSLKALQFCPRRYQYSIMQGWRSHGESVDLDFGIKFHDCLEVYERRKIEGVPDEDIKREVLTLAMRLAKNWQSDDSNKNPFTLIRSVMWYIFYWEQYDEFKTVEEIAGEPAIERQFNITLPAWASSIEDYSIVGYLDGVVQDKDGNYFIKEQKTTKKTPNSHLVDTYRTDTQIEFYSWAGQFIFPSPISAILMDFTQTAVGFTSFFRATIVKPKDNLDEFAKDLRSWIEVAQEYALAEYWPKNGRNCFMCPFKQVCAAEPEVRPVILKGDFYKRLWDPTKPKETVYERLRKDHSESE